MNISALVTAGTVAFAIGIAVGAAVIYRWGPVRRIIFWDVEEEWCLLPQKLSELIAAPVSVHIGERNIDSLSLVTLNLTCTGNVVLQSVVFAVILNAGAEKLGLRVSGEHQTIPNFDDKTNLRITIGEIRPREVSKIEIAISGYKVGSVELAILNRDIQFRRSKVGWREWRNAPIARNVSIGLPGARYDAAARAMNIIAEELKLIRKIINR